MPSRMDFKSRAWPSRVNLTAPASGFSRPINVRSKVVLPAPSGPMSPCRRPPSKEKSVPSSAWLGPSFFLSPATSMPMPAMDVLPRKPDFDRHARLQGLVGVLERDLDPVDQPLALLARLNILGSELRLRTDEGHGSTTRLVARLRQERLQLLAGPQRVQHLLRDIDISVHLVEIGERQQAHARRRPFTGLVQPREHRAVDGRGDAAPRHVEGGRVAAVAVAVEDLEGGRTLLV